MPKTRNASRMLVRVSLLASLGCSSGGTSGGTPAAAPANLSYSVNPASYTVGTAISTNGPSSTGGAATHYAVSPGLPAGLALNANTGVIAGTPTSVTAAAIYVVTASNSAGSTTVNLLISVTAAPLHIASFVVGSDLTLSYADIAGDPDRLLDLPDEHTTFIPLGTGQNNYLVFGASKVASGPTGGAVVLQTTDLQTFVHATALGYNAQVFRSPVPIDGPCDPTYATEFDENYAAPGSVVQDPTLPAGNLIMIYEAENHCPGGVIQQPFYATTGFARSSDNGKTWPAFANGVLGGTDRRPVLKSINAQPSVPYPAMGDAIPSAFVDRSASGAYYLYVLYGYEDGGMTPNSDGMVRMARARLGADPLTFQKWYNGSFSQPGIGGLDAGVLPTVGCSPNGRQAMAEVTYNDDVGLHVLVFECRFGTPGARVGAWYYSTATSLDLQDWSTPQIIQNSQFPLTTPCPGKTSGEAFDGHYPSFMSPGAAAGHTKLTGRAFFMNGCDTGARSFMSRTFTITTGP